MLKMTMSLVGTAAKAAAMSETEDVDEKACMEQTLKMVWKAGKFEIDLALREVCAQVLVPLQEKLKSKEYKKYVAALKLVGSIFATVGTKAMTVQNSMDFVVPPESRQDDS